MIAILLALLFLSYNFAIFFHISKMIWKKNLSICLSVIVIGALVYWCVVRSEYVVLDWLAVACTIILIVFSSFITKKIARWYLLNKKPVVVTIGNVMEKSSLPYENRYSSPYRFFSKMYNNSPEEDDDSFRKSKPILWRHMAGIEYNLLGKNESRVLDYDTLPYDSRIHETYGVESEVDKHPLSDKVLVKYSIIDSSIAEIYDRNPTKTELEEYSKPHILMPNKEEVSGDDAVSIVSKYV